MWLATRENGRLLSFSTTKANNDYLDPHPVLVLPLDDIEGLTERVADAICRKRSLYPLAYCKAHFHLDYEKAMFMAEAVLSALGAKGGK